jgi:hypothetical protein
VFVCFLWFPESESDAGRLTWTKRPTVGEGLDATAVACSSCELDHVRAMRMRWSGSQSAAQLFLFSLDFDPQGAPEVVASELVSAGARRGQVTRPFFSQTFVKRGWLVACVDGERVPCRSGRGVLHCLSSSSSHYGYFFLQMMRFSL